MNIPMSDREKLDQKVKDFWGDIIFKPDGSLNEEQVYKELGDYQDFMHEVRLAYCDITNSKISKPNTWHKYVIEAVDERIESATREAIQEYIEPHLQACRDYNGREWCKNCGLRPLQEQSGGSDDI